MEAALINQNILTLHRSLKKMWARCRWPGHILQMIISRTMFQPIVVDTTMYVYGKNSSLIALSVVTGKEIWIHTNLQGVSRRGLNYWESKNKKDKRLVFTLNNSIQEIDAITGKSIRSFGDSGYVDMRVRVWIVTLLQSAECRPWHRVLFMMIC